MIQIERNLLGSDIEITNSHFKLACRVMTLLYIGQEMHVMTSSFNDQITGNDPVYSLLHGRSTKLFEYSDLDESEEVEPFHDVSSLYVSHKYESAPTLWAHNAGADKVTVVYNSFT